MYTVNKLLSLIGWQIHPSAVNSRLRMLNYHNIHMHDRCFILGNGPSLKNMDLSVLRDEITFGLNRIYLLFPELGYNTSYYVSVNRLVIQQSASDINSLETRKFISWYTRQHINFDKNTVFVRDPGDGLISFSKDPRSKIWEGATVTYVAMQIAYYMGFEQVVLIGVDHSFSTIGEPHSEVISQGDDKDHFSPDYFGRGYRWQLPDLDTSTRSYELAKLNFENAGREIVDATVNGKLTVFPKVDFQTLL